MTEKSDFDGAWKVVMERFFRQFLEFFLPEAAAQIDGSRPFSFLDKELQQVAPSAETGRRMVDRLVKVYRKGGGEEWVLVHVEVQAQVDLNLAERMSIYHHRIRDRYQRNVASLVILGDDRPEWRPYKYENELWGTRTLLSFPMVKLLDWQDRWSELEASQNPFATVVMAHLKALGTRGADEDRLDWKYTLIRSLYDQGHDADDMRELFKFIDWVLVLPRELDRKMYTRIRRYEEKHQMPRMTSIERIGLEKGLKQGLKQGREEGRQEALQEGLRASVLAVLDARFGPPPEDIARACHELCDLALLEQLVRRAADVESIEAFRLELP